MKQIVFATNNLHKLREVRQILGSGFDILSLADINCHDEIPETADTFEGNALQKAMWVKQHYGYDCFADDSGIEVDALDGAPGVFSARYAGLQRDDQANNDLLMKNLEGVKHRDARYRAAIALVTSDAASGDIKHRFFNGAVEGDIVEVPSTGTEGFGYDPLFRPKGWNVTFADADADAKHAISHRGKAVRMLADYLLSLDNA